MNIYGSRDWLKYYSRTEHTWLKIDLNFFKYCMVLIDICLFTMFSLAAFSAIIKLLKKWQIKVKAAVFWTPIEWRYEVLIEASSIWSPWLNDVCHYENQNIEKNKLHKSYIGQYRVGIPLSAYKYFKISSGQGEAEENLNVIHFRKLCIILDSQIIESQSLNLTILFIIRHPCWKPLVSRYSYTFFSDLD